MLRMLLVGCLLANLSLVVSAAQPEQPKPLRIYLDADRSGHLASARAIEMGIKTAFAEVDNQIQGRQVEFIPLDHRGNSTRSRMNMERAFADPSTLFMMAGLHSPPLINNRDYINQQRMLTLVPWAAGGPITRYPGAENWIFRLSADDTKAGYRIAQYAIQQNGCQQPELVLEQTPWGQSNASTLLDAVQKELGTSPGISWFHWNISPDSARIKLRHIAANGSDCILFVGNVHDGTTFVRAMNSMPVADQLPMFSHWGITGGDFEQQVPHEMRERVRLSFLQTCFSFVSSEPSALSAAVLAQAQALFPELITAKELKAPGGFIHAYDLGRLVITALQEMEISPHIGVTRDRLRRALEDLQTPVQGLLKRYQQPFAINGTGPDAHEALGMDDLCMARYGPADEILLVDR